MNSKFFYTIIFSLFFQFLFCQENILLDTLGNEAYKKELEQFYLNQTQKTEILINQISDTKLKSEMREVFREKKSKFLQQINSGKFVYHKEISPLIDKIFNDIKTNNPNENFNNIKIILALDEEVNAYNSGEGIVVINLPLVLNINDELELSFIICHEISHQMLNHVYNSVEAYLKKGNSKEMIEKARELEKVKYNRRSLVKAEVKKFVYHNRRFSRDKEHQADSLGFVYFSKTNPKYLLKSTEALACLKYVDKEKDSLTKKDYHVIFDNTTIVFQDEWLETEDFSSYNYQKMTKFWDIDSLRTHPDIDERIAYLKDKFKISESQISEYNKLNYLTLKSKSKYDEIFMLYYLKEYGKSLYKTMILLKEDKENPILKKMMYDNLNMISEYKNQYKLNQCLETESPYFSESYNMFLSFIRNLRKATFNQILKIYEY
jgi:hypothetical protein